MPLDLFRRELLTVAAALPVLGCALDKEGIPGDGTGNDTGNDTGNGTGNDTGNDTGNETGNGTDTPTPLEPPFDHAVKLNVNDLISPNRLTKLTVQFIATLDNNFERKSPEHFFDSPNFPSLPFSVTDKNVIDLSEAGTVTCTCTFEYLPPPPAQIVEGPVSHQKVADVELPEFELTVVNQEYHLV
jgi:hypothetical protein